MKTNNSFTILGVHEYMGCDNNHLGRHLMVATYKL